MRVPFLLAWLMTWLVRGALTLLVIALILVGFLDESISSENPGFTLFQAVVAGFDPYLRSAALRTLILGISVTAIATLLGEWLAILALQSRRLHSLNRMVWTLGFVMPPAVVALGLISLAEVCGADSVMLTTSTNSLLAQILSELPWATALVGTLVSHRVDRIGPAWAEQARQSGGRLGVARARSFLIRPIVRPEASRAASLVFLTTVCEPGAPFILGEKGNLAVQATLRLIDGENLGLVALIAFAALVLGLSGFGLIRTWGGVGHAPHPPGEDPLRPGQVHPPRMGRAQPFLTVFRGIGALVNCGFVLGPLVGLVAGFQRLTSSLLLSNFTGFELRIAAESTLKLGFGVGALALGLSICWTAASSRGVRMWSSRGVPLVPPSILAVAALAAWQIGSSASHSTALRPDSFWCLVFVSALTMFPSAVGEIRRSWQRLETALDHIIRIAGPRGGIWLTFSQFQVPLLLKSFLGLAWAGAVESQAAVLLSNSTHFVPVGPELFRLASSHVTLPAACATGLGIVGSGLLLRLLGCQCTWFGIVDRS